MLGAPVFLCVLEVGEGHLAERARDLSGVRVRERGGGGGLRRVGRGKEKNLVSLSVEVCVRVAAYDTMADRKGQGDGRTLNAAARSFKLDLPPAFLSPAFCLYARHAQ